MTNLFNAGKYLILAGAASTAVAAAVPVTTASAAAAVRTRASASVVPGEFFGVSATSASDAWAVGDDGGLPLPMIWHWNGQAWQRSTVPSPGTDNGGLLVAVSAISTSDAWAVGSSFVDNTSGGLIYHWHGSAWQLVNAPFSGGLSPLTDVAASSASNVWVVGTLFPFQGSPSAPFIWHWNGASWRSVPCPCPDNASLAGVAVRSADDAWAVGSGAHGGMLLLHWNGKSWRRLPDPAVSGPAALNAVAMNSATDAWAVGSVGALGNRPLIVHWNGRIWKVVPGAPTLAGSSPAVFLDGVAMFGRGKAWAVGTTKRGATFVELWNGRAWRRLPSPSPGGGGAVLAGVTATSAANAWAVGFSNNFVTLEGHILHWNGAAWQVSPAGP